MASDFRPGPGLHGATEAGLPGGPPAAQATGNQRQTITWVSPAPGQVLLLNEPHPLVATSSSGLPVTFRVLGGPGVIQDGVVTARDTGAITLIAEQFGDATYGAASMRMTFNQGRLTLSKLGEWQAPESAPAHGVQVDGHRVLLAVYTGGLHLLDVSRPESPVRLSGYDSPGWAYDTALIGNTVYLADYDRGLQILDVSNPGALIRRSGYNTPGNAGAIQIDGNRAYIADRLEGLLILDVSDPLRPAAIGNYRTGTAVLGVHVVGNRAYVAANEDGLHIVDVSNPAAPRLVGHLDISGNTRAVEVVGNRAYVAAASGGMSIVDVANPALPIRIGGYNTAGQTYQVRVVGDRAYLADGSAGLLVLDISDPTRPVPVTSFQTGGRTDDLEVVGNLVFAAAGARGLVVVQASERLNQTLQLSPSSLIRTADSPVLLQATASSRLPVALTLVSGPAELSGNQLRITGVGDVVLRLEQSGNKQFLPASLERTLSVELSPPQETSIVIQRDPASPGVLISVPEQPDLYFTLEQTRDWSRYDPVAMSLGTVPMEWSMPIDPSESHLAFRLRANHILLPADSDGDGIDDVYELMHADFQDPLDPADAAEFFESGWTKLEEYQHRNDPERPPVASPVDMVIGCSDTRYEGRDVIVDGITLTVDCRHTFRSLTVTNGGRVVTSPTSGQPLHLIVTRDVVVASNSVVSVNARGHGREAGPGGGRRTIDSASGSGGGHGGRGGQGNSAHVNFADGGDTYGSWEQPVDFGSGGGLETGGRGGGAVRLEVGGTLRLEGVISADGGPNPDNTVGGSGAGGSVWIETGTMAGAGLITANGGYNPQSVGMGVGAGGGGGGRIAIHYGTNTFTGDHQAFGGKGSWAQAGSGTIYLRRSSDPLGTLIIAENWNEGSVRREAAELWGKVEVGQLIVETNGWLSHPLTNGLHLRIEKDAWIQKGGGISVNARGHGREAGPGGGRRTIDSASGSGGGHGGRGGQGNSAHVNFADGGDTYGSWEQPVDFGSGGGLETGGRGGGAVRLEVGGTLRLEGVISADGGPNPDNTVGGSGAGGSVWIETGTMAGAGLITANGGYNPQSVGMGVGAGGGGGGRIAIHYGTNTFTGDHQAFGGKGSWAQAGSGTIYLRRSSDPLGTLIIAENWNEGSVRREAAELWGKVEVGQLIVETNGWLSHPLTNGLHLRIEKDAWIQKGGGISVNARGHGREAGPGGGRRTIDSASGSGGGHGGRGGQGNSAHVNFADGGDTYGSWEQPVDFGSGGGLETGGRGGGAVRLEVGDELRVDGTISADGALLDLSASANSGAGAGGSVWLEAGTLTGTGLISAVGGTNAAALGQQGGGGGGGGGGGRIAIYTSCPPDLADLTLSVEGGAGAQAGEAGTLYVGVIRSGLQGVVPSPGPWLQIPPPASVAFQTLTNESAMLVFTERTNIVLSEPLAVNLTQPGAYTNQAALAAGFAHLRVGLPISSHYVHFDTGHTNQAESEVLLEITLTFDSEILGAIVLTDELVASDPLLGHPGTVYPDTEPRPLRGLEIGDGIGRDGIVLHEDRRSITIIGNVRDWADQVRIITNAYGECP